MRKDAAMKRTVATVGLVCALMIGCMGMPPVRAAESDTDKVTTDIGTKVMPFEELSVEVVDSMSIPSMTRATSRIEWNISPDTVMKADTAYSLEADEIVTINCTYSPRTANLDFGFITQDDTFHFTSGSNGSIKTNIQIDKTGKYYFDWFSISRPIIFSISSSWVKSSIPYEKRFDRYLEYNFFESQIHWFSVFNSFMIVVFLAGLVALIMIRTLSLDYRRYTQESMEGSESISRDDSGWKRVHGDVFRACSHLPLYSVLIGNGAHIVYTVIVSLVLILTMAQYLGRKKYVECLT